MKRSKQILFYTLTLVGLALLEILVSVLYQAFPTQSILGTRLFHIVSRILAVIPPFLMLGTAIGAIRARSFSHALTFFFIAVGILLFAQVPISLFSFAAATDPTVLYGEVLATFMLSTAIECVLFFLVLVLVNAVFLQGKRPSSEESDRLLTLKSDSARAVMLASLLLAVYNLAQELIAFFRELKGNLGILTSEAAADLLMAVLFLLFLAFFCFVTGRVGERLFPTAPADDENTDADFINEEQE